MNTSIIQVGKSYKVPHGFELPFAGRFLKVVAVHAGAVDFVAAGGNYISLGHSRSAILAQNAEVVR
jgi:hypothetical protein